MLPIYFGPRMITIHVNSESTRLLFLIGCISTSKPVITSGGSLVYLYQNNE
ncbi:hypothetical protein KDRO_B04920 [Kluyveromyces lactis]|nr:hypothetical protein KDRO_B04920 [Kluyveromyces lactis]